MKVLKTSPSKYFSLQINGQTEALISFYPSLEQKGKICQEQRTKSFLLFFMVFKKMKK